MLNTGSYAILTVYIISFTRLTYLRTILYSLRQAFYLITCPYLFIETTAVEPYHL